VLAVFAIAKIDMEFFSVTGLILVFGLGLDYIIYMMENEKKATAELKILEPFATMVSFVTTIISFGALALSSFKPVHLIGLSIFIGLTTAYISSFFYGRQK
jgi:predicted exporter